MDYKILCLVLSIMACSSLEGVTLSFLPNDEPTEASQTLEWRQSRTTIGAPGMDETSNRFVGEKQVICANTRTNDANKKGHSYTCQKQMDYADSSCRNYLKWKDCDLACNLCPCSTAGTKRAKFMDAFEGEHCSGHGTCKAECTQLSCKNAKCVCKQGWTGDKCETPPR